MSILKIINFSTIILLLFFGFFSKAGANQISNNPFVIDQIIVANKLETVETRDLYNGETEDVLLLNEPDEGNAYVLVYIPENLTQSEIVNGDDYVLGIGESAFARVTDDSFLSKHGYPVLGHGKVLPMQKG